MRIGDLKIKQESFSTHLNERVDVVHKSLSSTDDELVHAGYSVGPERDRVEYNEGLKGESQRRRAEEETRELFRPDLGAAVLEELQEFGDHDVERPV